LYAVTASFNAGGHGAPEPQCLLSKLGIYIGAVVGSLCMGFNRTFWTNAVEAEVYGLSMLVFLTILYLLIEWYERRETEHGDRILVLIFYLALLGIRRGNYKFAVSGDDYQVTAFVSY
jgi:hypothetical protein